MTRRSPTTVYFTKKAAERRQRLAEQGLCVRCGERPPKAGTFHGKPIARCVECISRESARTIAKRALKG